MIKIPVSKIQKNKMEKIYWNWICKYHMEEIEHIIKRDKVMKELVLNRKKSFKDSVKQFLLSDYKELENIKKRIDKMREKDKFPQKETKDFMLARYVNFRSSQAAKIVNVLGMTVCPYCNQNHLNIVYEKENRVRFWGDLDHFYDKGTYPELVICLYNMIPVCKVCNQLKSSQKARIINPYNCTINSGIKFKTEFDEKIDLDYLQGKTENFNIVIDKYELTEEDLEEIQLFDLENRYKNLKKNVQEIIIKSRAYDCLYQEQLKEKFGLEEEEIKSYIFGYTDNHLNRVLSKFNLDIMKEFINND